MQLNCFTFSTLYLLEFLVQYLAFIKYSLKYMLSKFKTHVKWGLLMVLICKTLISKESKLFIYFYSPLVISILKKWLFILFIFTNLFICCYIEQNFVVILKKFIVIDLFVIDQCFIHSRDFLAIIFLKISSRSFSLLSNSGILN